MDDLSHSDISLCPKKGRCKGTERQRKDYLDKSAMLGEIAYNQPLIEHTGDQYF